MMCLCFGATQSLAQKKSQEFIVLKMVIKKEAFEQQLKIPVAKSFYESELTGGGFAINDCGDCLLTAEYEFYGFAEKFNRNKFRISVAAKFKNRKACDFEDKIFTVSRNRSAKLKLKCGIELIAYRESETTDE